jgi:hypothetical protein
MNGYEAMKLANIWRDNPQGCAWFGITGDLVNETVNGAKTVSEPRREYEIDRDISARTMPPLKPYPYRRRMQEMAKRFGTWGFHTKACRDRMGKCICNMVNIGLVSRIDDEVWEIPEFI